jgi:hypothetical protein
MPSAFSAFHTKILLFHLLSYTLTAAIYFKLISIIVCTYFLYGRSSTKLHLWLLRLHLRLLQLYLWLLRLYLRLFQLYLQLLRHHLRLHCIFDYFDCISDCFNYISAYYDYISDCFYYTSDYYDYIFDTSTTFLTASPIPFALPPLSCHYDVICPWWAGRDVCVLTSQELCSQQIMGWQNDKIANTTLTRFIWLALPPTCKSVCHRFRIRRRAPNKSKCSGNLWLWLVGK